MSSNFRQITTWTAPKREWLATIAPSPEELKRSYGIEFVSGADDLGHLQSALIATPPGREFLLLKYDNPHQEGTMVWVSADERNFADAWKEFRAALALSSQDTLEVSPRSA